MLDTGPPKITDQLTVESILSEQDPYQTSSIFIHVFMQQDPRLWEAFLRNKVLNASLSSVQLKVIVEMICSRLTDPHESYPKEELRQALVIIHQNRMLFWVLRKSFSKEEKIRLIFNFANNEMVDIAVLWVLQENEPNMAHDLVKIFYMPHPILWRAFLLNNVLNRILFHTNVKWILNSVKEELSKKVVDNSNEWEKVLVSIAQNPNWCRELSYSYFISIAEVSSRLRNYIMSTESFCTQLAPFHIGVLATKFPYNVDKLIQTLLEIFKDEKSKDKQLWAMASLKRIIILSHDARVKITCSLEYLTILRMLKEEFKTDRFFAKDVLNIPYLVKMWLGRNELFAYKDKLLTEVSDSMKQTANLQDELTTPMHKLIISKSKPDEKEYLEGESKVLLEKLGLSLFPRNR
jgi:hypothetical protein